MSAPVKPLGIVVAVDGSAASDTAVVWAARDAAMHHIPLTLFHAVVTPTTTWPPVPYPDSVLVKLEDDCRQQLAHAFKLAEEAMPAGHQVTITKEFVYSTPALALIKMSDDAEMIVVGSSGRGLLARGVLGSVSSTVVRHAKCPVAVIRDEDVPDPQHGPVLVGIDGSPASELATAIAFDQASRRGVDLVALHAWSDVAILELPAFDWESVEAEAERSLTERLAGWHEQYPDVTVRRLLVRDLPAQQIIQQTKSLEAQLVVVGSHGRGGLTGLILGSVSNTVLHSVLVPVIVARPT
ncbi:universal stress protein [Mycobacterium lentiflavum]|uniref:Universal stress protein n=1 Tax=Mycobacterium lentiflavum TaxID=141349 RepID=A0A0E4H1Q6_MYCLN|nr:universal stress protein [Mycobacterium lentiflavum]MEE3062538.1 universal stress protein [Actinomycetota bacterium]ULP40428.1 universal stress protein [Mycobacterium lentiflavum]CQD15416.1 universal stress protein [Mycobacterium lentiflavum]